MEYCNEVTLKNIKLLSWRYFHRMDPKNSGEKDFEADLLFIVKDQRQSYVSSSDWSWPYEKFWIRPPTHWANLNVNMDPIRMDAVIRDSST